jgi:hypothetical protein
MINIYQSIPETASCALTIHHSRLYQAPVNLCSNHVHSLDFEYDRAHPVYTAGDIRACSLTRREIPSQANRLHILEYISPCRAAETIRHLPRMIEYKLLPLGKYGTGAQPFLAIRSGKFGLKGGFQYGDFTFHCHGVYTSGVIS